MKEMGREEGERACSKFMGFHTVFVVDTVILYPVIPFINVTEIRTLRSSSLNARTLGALLL